MSGWPAAAIFATTTAIASGQQGRALLMWVAIAGAVSCTCATVDDLRKCWPKVVRAIGGVHRLGKLWLVIHDRGVTIAWRQREVFRFPA